MKIQFAIPAVLVAVPLLVPSAAHAGPKPKPTPKPAKAPVQLIREVLGTKQLTGYEGSLGQTFTIGKNSPVNFTLKSAAYSVDRVNIGSYSHLPKSDEKLLVLHFTVQNPRKTAFNYSGGQLLFKAVDSGGVTRDAVGDVAREVTRESLNIQLQPGQKVEGYTAIRVAAYGEVPKLIVQSYYEPEGPIVRYDLRGKVTRLAEPFADPADALTARKIVPGARGTFYPASDPFDVRVDEVKYSTEAIANRKPDTGKRWCIANVTVKNKGARIVRVSQSYFLATLKDADGEKTSYNQSLLKGSRDEQADAELQPGEEAKVRFYWPLPENVEAASVLLQYGYDRESRTYAVDVSK